MESLLLLGLIASASAQEKEQLRQGDGGDHPSNGMLEMSVSYPQPTPREVKEMEITGKRWRGGLLAITLKNISHTEIVNVTDSDLEAQYEFEVWDIEGKSVPLTAAGEKLRVNRLDRLAIHLSTESKTLHPGEQYTIRIDISRLFQIKSQQMYTVRIRRTDGLPNRTQDGQKLDRELNRTWVITGHEDR